MRALGHQTMVVAPDYGFEQGNDNGDILRVTSLSFPNLRFSIPLEFMDWTAIEEKVTSFNPDLIHAHHPFKLGKSALDLADQLEVPLVYTYHTLYEFFTHYFLMDTEPVRKQVREYVVNFANCCDQVITPTEPIRQHLIEMGVNTRTASIPTGIDFSRFDNIPAERIEQWRQKLNLARFDKILFCAGRISREKNLGLILHALRALSDSGRNYGLVIAGKGPARRPLQKEVAGLKLEDRVVWTGFVSQEELPELYLLSDLFLFPSPSDTQGIVLYEAQAAGKPIVAVESMASQAIVTDGKNGRFAKNDAADFAEKIKEVLDHPERFNAPFDREAFSKESLGRRYEELYLELASSGRSRKRKQLGTIFFPFFNP